MLRAFEPAFLLGVVICGVTAIVLSLGNDSALSWFACFASGYAAGTAGCRLYEIMEDFCYAL